MQLIEGNSLNQEMKAMVNAGLQMPFDRISTILLQLSEALEYLGDLDPQSTTGTQAPQHHDDPLREGLC